MNRALLVCVLPLAACAGQRGACERAPEPAADESGALAEPRLDRASLAQLAVAVAQLEADGNRKDIEHAQTVEALKLVAKTVASLDVEGAARAQAEIKAAAARIEKSPTHELSHADAVRAGLARAVDAVAQAVGQDDPAVARQISSARTAVGRVDPDKPLLSQSTQSAKAFAAVLDVLLLANGQDPDTYMRAHTGLPHSARNLQVLVQEMNQSEGQDVVTTIGRLLDALADAAALLSRGESSGDDAMQELRLAARKLSRGPDAFEVVTVAQKGLDAAMKALAALPADAEEKQWIRAAEKAIKAIEDDTLLAFARAGVQDAARATVDAYVVVIQREPGIDIGAKP